MSSLQYGFSFDVNWISIILLFIWISLLFFYKAALTLLCYTFNFTTFFMLLYLIDDCDCFLWVMGWRDLIHCGIRISIYKIAMGLMCVLLFLLLFSFFNKKLCIFKVDGGVDMASCTMYLILNWCQPLLCSGLLGGRTLLDLGCS